MAPTINRNAHINDEFEHALELQDLATIEANPLQVGIIYGGRSYTFPEARFLGLI